MAVNQITSTSNFWITKGALIIALNALDNPNYIQVSVTAGAVILCYVKGYIEFDASHNYKKWKIEAFPTVLDKTEEYFVYARIPKEGEGNALIIYSPRKIDLLGEEIKESGISEEYGLSEGNIPGTDVSNFYFVYLGHISKSENKSKRIWIENLIEKGKLATDQQQNEITSGWKTLFDFDKARNLIISKFPFLELAAEKFKIKKGEDSKEIKDIKRSFDSDAAVPIADNNVPTSKYVNSKFVSKVKDDTAHGKITFEQGAEFGKFVPGLLGSGGHIDGSGRGELRSLRLWETLEVPELRYNRVSVYIGIRMDTFGGGIIESVTPDTIHDGVGSATLKLENGEYGAVEEGDLMMGIWHDMDGNSADTVDDHLGNFTFAGFKTVYFQITGVSGSRNERITYMLRSRSSGGNGVHPFASMHFAARGNIYEEKKDRHAFVYSTTQYSVSLTGVMSWNFRPEHYYEIHGNLEGFRMPAIGEDGKPYMKTFHEHGVVFGNAYIFGEIDKFKRKGYYCNVNQSMNGMLMPNEEEKVYVTVFDGYGIDVTEQFTRVSVTRNSGDAASDAYWNAQPERQNSTNPFTIAYKDLGIDGIRQTVAVFDVVMSDEVNGTVARGNLDYF